jgi:hypothetical protein
VKVMYFKYWIEHDAQRYRTSIGDIIQAFSKIQDSSVRLSFKSGDDNLFIFPSSENVYLFIVTKDDELIKAISADTIKQVDIASKLDNHERIGFASYVYIGKNFIGMASTIHGPKIKKLIELINEILNRCGKADHQFVCAPFEMSVTPKQAMKFDFKGAVRMEIPRGANLFNTLIPSLGNPRDVQRIVIEMHPDVRSPMSEGADAAIQMADKSGMTKLMLKAKDSLADQLTDYYLIGSGNIGRAIAAKNEKDICLAIIQDVDNNLALREALAEYENDADYRKGPIDTLRDIGHGNSMVTRLVAGGRQN